jgi:hypothetical protein
MRFRGLGGMYLAGPGRGHLSAPTSTVMNVLFPQIMVNLRVNGKDREAATRRAEHAEDAS